MTGFKTITALILSFCIILTGFPVQATPQCPTDKMQMAIEMGKMEDCAGMAKAKQEKKSGCCDDTACTMQCTSATTASIGFISKFEVPLLVPQSQVFQMTDDTSAFFQLNTQERPPKHLS